MSSRTSLPMSTAATPVMLKADKPPARPSPPRCRVATAALDRRVRSAPPPPSLRSASLQIFQDPSGMIFPDLSADLPGSEQPRYSKMHISGEEMSLYEHTTGAKC